MPEPTILALTREFAFLEEELRAAKTMSERLDTLRQMEALVEAIKREVKRMCETVTVAAAPIPATKRRSLRPRSQGRHTPI